MSSGTETKDWKEYVHVHKISLFSLSLSLSLSSANISLFLPPSIKIIIALFLHRLLSELGYRLVPDCQSRAVSVIHLDDDTVSMETDHTPNTAAGGTADVDLSQEQLAELTMKHAGEMKLLQAEYE